MSTFHGLSVNRTIFSLAASDFISHPFVIAFDGAVISHGRWCLALPGTIMPEFERFQRGFAAISRTAVRNPRPEVAE